MELQERLAVEIREAEQPLQDRARSRPRQDEAVSASKLAAVEAGAGRRPRRARRLAPRSCRAALLADYDAAPGARRRGGGGGERPAFCGGCRVSIRPQAIQELRATMTVMMLCESCGRYLYWQE